MIFWRSKNKRSVEHNEWLVLRWNLFLVTENTFVKAENIYIITILVNKIRYFLLLSCQHLMILFVHISLNV